MAADPARTVRKRHVFYIPGHDPAGGRRYREIYRAESAKQAAISGYGIEMQSLASEQGTYRWGARATIDGVETEATIDYLKWNDLVRDSLTKSVLSSYWLMLRTLWIYLSAGAFGAIARTRPVMLFTTLYPFALYILAPLAGLLVGLILSALLGLAVPVPWWATVALALAGVWGGMWLFRRYDQKFFITYLVLAYAFIGYNRGGYPPGLDQRARDFAEKVAAALESDVDEVLIVGHSAGAGIGVEVCAQLLRAGRVPEGKLALMGIGPVTQMISFLPRAQWMRSSLNLLAQTDHLAWVEVSAPSDGMCFALSDPVATTGVDPAPEKKRWPVVFSAAYKLALSEELRASPEFTIFRMHFQYLYAFDRPRDYDYFQITAGPQTLMARYGARKSSKGLITRPASRYRDF